MIYADVETQCMLQCIYSILYINIVAVFHNGCKYDYKFIIKELAGEGQKQVNC